MKKFLKCFLITFLLLFVLFLIIGILGSSNKNSVVVETSEETVEEMPEPNTSKMVDYIAREAKQSANLSATEEKRDEAIAFIKDNYPDYFKDNDTMEKTMYYGYYLEYAYAKDGADNLYANLGMDAYQAVKNVYRNTEAVDDQYVTENLRQIKEALTELGYVIKE